MENKGSKTSYEDPAATKGLTREEELELTQAVVKKGKKAAQAKEKLITANNKLVVSIAREHQRLGLDLEDLISEGNIGLMKAIDKFDPSLGYRLSTYACWWVREQIREAIAKQGSTIRVPSYARDISLSLRKEINQLSLELSRNPTLHEIASQTGMTPQRIEEVLSWGHTPLSLESENEEKTQRLSDTLIDENTMCPMTSAIKSGDASWTHELLSTLDEQETEVLKRHYGFDGDPETFEVIGQSFGVTRERVRQIEIQALKKLRKKIGQLSSLQR